MKILPIDYTWNELKEANLTQNTLICDMKNYTRCFESQ